MSPKANTPRVPDRAVGLETGASRAAQVRFALVFCAIAGVASFAYYFPHRAGSFADVCLTEYLRVYVRCVGAVLGRLDSTVSVSGFDVQGRFPLRIVRDCDGMQINILFAAAVIAFPSTWARRMGGLAAGIGLLATLNVVRLCSLYFVGVYWPADFDFVHREVWPIIFVVVALAVFAAWAGLLARSAPEPT
jgi:exosortase/archaeosortase family protein